MTMWPLNGYQLSESGPLPEQLTDMSSSQPCLCELGQVDYLGVTPAVTNTGVCVCGGGDHMSHLSADPHCDSLIKH